EMGRIYASHDRHYRHPCRYAGCARQSYVGLPLAPPRSWSRPLRHPHRWEQMLPEEFLEEQARAPIVYWPCGSVEEHGLQCVMGVDPFSAQEVCLRAAAISGGIVHPPVWIAPAGVPGFSRAELRAGETYPYPPSLWVSRETCELVYTELLE